MSFYNKSFVIALAALCIAQPLFAQQPNDPDMDLLWYLDHIGVTDVWEDATGSDEVIVAVLDTGIDLDHVDLVENIWVNEGEIAGDGIDNDQNGYIDDVNGWDFIDQDATPSPDRSIHFDKDAIPHGTMVAGIIAAVGDNAEGISGISWSSKIMPIRVMDNFGAGNTFAAYEGVEYAIANGADVINMSFSSFEFDVQFRNAIEKAHEAGIVVVAAAGNLADGGLNMNTQPMYPVCYGAGQGEDWVIGVAATDTVDQKASFSNYGSHCTDVSAPGVDFYSTYYFDETWSSFAFAEYYGYWQGTSMSAPVVSGAVALLLGQYPTLTPSQVQLILQLSVDPVVYNGTVLARQMGTGRVNIASAFQIASRYAETVESDVQTDDSVDWQPSTHIVVASESGSSPMVRVFDKSGVMLTEFLAYDEEFLGGVRVAMGDVDGDKVDEIVVVPGAGLEAEVRMFEQDGTFIDSFTFFDGEEFGFYVATGDVDGDQVEEIFVSTDMNGSGRIGIFTQAGDQVHEWSLNEQAGESIRIAAGDTDGDGIDEAIVSFGEGVTPGVQVLGMDGSLKAAFFAYAESYQNGVFVSAGDINNDGRDEIVTGTDVGGGPHVQVFMGDGTHLGTFFAYEEDFRGGVRVSVGNLSDDIGGTASIITAAGPGGGPHIRVFNDHADLIGSFFTDDESDRYGVNVSAWSY